MPTGLLIGAAIVGVGLQAYGTNKSIHAAKDANAAQQQMIAAQMEQERIRRQAMELDARRKQVEILRQTQRARALSYATATAQGANTSSGVGGAIGQISGQGNWNALGVSQNLGLGEQMFGTNMALSQAKMGYANAQSEGATGAGLSSLGGSIVQSASAIGNLGGNMKAGSPFGKI